MSVKVLAILIIFCSVWSVLKKRAPKMVAGVAFSARSLVFLCMKTSWVFSDMALCLHIFKYC